MIHITKDFYHHNPKTIKSHQVLITQKDIHIIPCLDLIKDVQILSKKKKRCADDNTCGSQIYRDEYILATCKYKYILATCRYENICATCRYKFINHLLIL